MRQMPNAAEQTLDYLKSKIVLKKMATDYTRNKVLLDNQICCNFYCFLCKFLSFFLSPL